MNLFFKCNIKKEMSISEILKELSKREQKSIRIAKYIKQLSNKDSTEVLNSLKNKQLVELFPIRANIEEYFNSNKGVDKDILKYGISCVQSVDRIELAEKLQQKLAERNQQMDVFIQVNTSNEESKFGVTPENALELVKQVAQLPNLTIKGLMTIGLFSSDEEKIRQCFKRLKQIQQDVTQLALPNVDVSELSMGMSGDLEIAIEEGATIVRVGTAIFGKRIYPDSYYWNENKA